MSSRAFPHSVESERALLGGVLKRPDLLAAVVQGLKASDFYRSDHQALFQLLVEMHGRGEATDLVTVPERVARDEHPERFGGVGYVVELPDHVPSTANLDHYSRIIQQKALLRQLITTTQAITDAAYGQPDDITGLIDRAQREVVEIGKSGSNAEWHEISVVVDEQLLEVQKREEQEGDIVGLTTGFFDLDNKLAGLQKGALVVLAARPSMGKTALALNMAQNAALLTDAAVGIYSLEMGRGSLVDRMLCTHALVDANRLRKGNLTVEDWERLLASSDALRKSRIYINDRPGLTIAEIRAHARRLATNDPALSLIVIDYLQLMAADDARASRVQQVSEMSRGLKALAMDLEIPVLALSQLSRAVEQRQDKRPVMSDLRESGAIEQDADVVLFIYRDEYYNPDTVDTGIAEVIIAKQRNGPTGTIRLAFQGQYTRFDTLAEIDVL